MSGTATWPPKQLDLVCTFSAQVQVFLVLLQTVTGQAVLHVPVAGTVLG